MASGSSGMSGLDILPKLQTPPVQGPSLSQCNGAHLEERAVASDQLHMEAQVSAHTCICHFILFFTG